MNRQGSTGTAFVEASLHDAVAALEPVVALVTLVQLTGDRMLLDRYGPLLDGTQKMLLEAFVAFGKEAAKVVADPEAVAAIRSGLIAAIDSNREPIVPHLDKPLFRKMARLVLGLDLPEMSIEPAFQHAGFTRDTRVRKAKSMPPAGFKVLVVGAGMIGINAAVKLQQAGFEYQIIEKLDGVGGNWRENIYPGAAVDTPSMNYSFSFAPNASWTKHYPNGPEFLAYLDRVVDDHGVRSKIDFNTTVSGARWDETRKLWVVSAQRDGKPVDYEGNFLIMAVGPNNSPKCPDVKNLSAFKGPVIHSAHWDHSVDLAGKKVVLVGTGCSGVQVATAIADSVDELVIVQRQPEHIIPNPTAHASVDPLDRWAMENIPFVAQWRRLQGLSSQLQDMTGMLMIDEEHRRSTGGVSPFNDGMRAMCDGYVKAHFPDDPAMVELLTPEFPIFAKRPILDCGFYDTLKKPNVSIVRGALAECDAEAVILADGTRIDCDVLLLSTGYKLMFGTQFDIKGRAKSLVEAFDPYPYSYEGMLVPHFPNFVLTGAPYSFLVANHAIVSEQQVHYAIELLQWMVDKNLDSVDVTPAATKAFVDDVDENLKRTTWVNCGSANGYYRHGSGKVIIAIPRHNSRIWHDLRMPRPRDFTVTHRPEADQAPEREMVMLSI